MINKKRILILITILTIFFVVPVFSNNTNTNNNNNEIDLETSDLITLFKDKEYDITLDDFYDDADVDHLYTGANFSYYDYNNDISYEEVVITVNNSESNHPFDTDVDMTTGTFDDTDNMHEDDGSNSEFTSTLDGNHPGTYSFEDEIEETGIDIDLIDSVSQAICEVIADLGGHDSVLHIEAPVSAWNYAWDDHANQESGTYEFWTRFESGNNKRRYLIPQTEVDGAAFYLYWHSDGKLYYNDGAAHVVGGYAANTWYHVRIDFECGDGEYMGLAADTWKFYIDEDAGHGAYNFRTTGNQIYRFWLQTADANVDWQIDAVGYPKWDGDYTVGDNLNADPAELDAGISSPESNRYDTEDLLALNITTSHYTSVATAVSMNVWNYDTTSWTNLGSSTKTSEFKNEYSITANIEDYFSPSGEILFSYNTSDAVAHTLTCDYIEFLLVYKLDLTHTISFPSVGVWKYQWEVYGTIHYTDWVIFEVIDPPPNFEAISESDYPTRWILQNSTLSPIEDFHDDINTDYWNLVDVSDINFDSSFSASSDSWVYSAYPDNNYGTSSQLTVMKTSTSGWAYLNFVNFNSTYLFNNQSDTYGIGVYTTQISGDINFGLYNSSSFVESTITYNNIPTLGDLQDSNAITSTGWNYFDVLDLDNYYTIKRITGTGSMNIHSEENTNDPIFIQYDVSKNYFGGGYMYMQTNETELISLESQDYGTHKTLSSGDYFEVDFQTSSDSQINLILLKDGEVQTTLVMSQSGNTNFNRHTAQISVSEDVEFDQLKISSTFEDTDNIKVYDIKTYKYTVVGDYADFYVGSKPSNKEIYLTPSDIYPYNLRIYEIIDGGETLKINIEVNINTTGQTQYLYIPTATQECRLALFSPDNIYLPLTDYHIYVNRSLNEEYNRFALLDDVFTADVGTYVYIDVYDLFNSLVESFSRLSSDYIDLELDVYQLRIKSLLEYKTTVNINGTNIYELLPFDCIEFMLATSYYLIGYYDDDNDYQTFTVYLNSNQAYALNKSELCFLSYADQQGNHLYFDNYKTYINGSMIYEQIFYEDAGDDVLITITDRYNFQVYSGVYSVNSGNNYIPIILTMYSLKVMNQQEAFNHINITRDPNYYDSEYYWSEWIAPNEIVEFKLFAGHYIFNITDTENGWSSYEYELNGDDVLLMSSDNIISNVIYNIANVNTTIGNQITNVQIDLTNQNSEINNTIINIEINLSNVNSSLGTLLTNINLDIVNINNNISELYTFTENNFLNLGNNINNSFISIANNIISINQTISTLVIGLDGKITIVNATINTMFTEMNSQFVVVQSTLDFSFAFLNQTIIQIGNNITNNQIALNNLIIQRANDIDTNIIQIQNLINLLNSTVANESLVVQTLVNIIGSNITENHIAINNLINLIGNNITENNVNLISLIELVGNNITTNHFVIQTLIDYVSNNISDNHLEVLTNINFINTTIGQNQIELINRLLFINNSINNMALDLTNQILLVNNTIYSAILDVSVSIDFNSDNILGNISLTYEQNNFLTELYKKTMFSQLINWSDVAYNYSIMEDRIDVWTIINDYRNTSAIIELLYNNITDSILLSAQSTIDQYLPAEGVEYRVWSVEDQKYLDDWQPLPDNMTIDFGFFEEIIPDIPDFEVDDIWLQVIIIIVMFSCIIALISYIAIRVSRRNKSNKKKLYNYISKGRDSEAEYYGGKETPF